MALILTGIENCIRTFLNMGTLLVIVHSPTYYSINTFQQFSNNTKIFWKHSTSVEIWILLKFLLCFEFFYIKFFASFAHILETLFMIDLADGSVLNLFVLVTQAASDTLTANGISIVFLKLPGNFDVIEHTIVSTFKLCIASSAFFIKLIKYAQFQSKQI